MPNNKTTLYLPSLTVRALSSVGSEHLVYTQGVGGSNPSAPTSFRKSRYKFVSGFFFADTLPERFNNRGSHLEIKHDLIISILRTK